MSVTVYEKIRDLAKQNLEAREIARVLGSPLGTVRTHLSTLRRRGEIGFYDGRTLSATNIPLPHMLLNLSCELRDLIDGEAKDRGMTPIDIVKTILTKVMNDQEMIEYILGEE